MPVHVAARARIDRERRIARRDELRRDRGIFLLARSRLVEQQNQRLGVVGLVEITADRFLVRRLEPYDGGFDRGFGSGGVVRGRRLGGLVLATGGEREQTGGAQGTDHVRLSCFKYGRASLRERLGQCV